LLQQRYRRRLSNNFDYEAEKKLVEHEQKAQEVAAARTKEGKQETERREASGTRWTQQERLSMPIG